MSKMQSTNFDFGVMFNNKMSNKTSYNKEFTAKNNINGMSLIIADRARKLGAVTLSPSNIKAEAPNAKGKAGSSLSLDNYWPMMNTHTSFQSEMQDRFTSNNPRNIELAKTSHASRNINLRHLPQARTYVSETSGFGSTNIKGRPTTTKK